MNYYTDTKKESTGALISKLGAKSIVFDHDSLRKFEVDGEAGYKLYPYEIKDRSLFYQRDHPTDLSPNSPMFLDYWGDFEDKCIEGLWVKDGENWVYMPNKLFYYVNYVKIVDEERKIIYPDMSSLELGFAAYFMCIDGFSGFEDDLEYTCNRWVEKLYNGEELEDLEIEMIPPTCYKKDGKLKTFVDPWEYLTRFYLIDNPCKNKLGHPLYQNDRCNSVILGARGVAKSFAVFIMDFMWEWTWGGISTKRSKEKGFDPEDDGKKLAKYKSEATNRLLFAMGSGDSQPLERSIKNIKAFYDLQPGSFEYPQDPNPKNRKPNYMGPFYKKTVGTWEVGTKIQHTVKNKQNNSIIEGNLLQTSVLTRDNKKVAAGDRFRRIYVEECGFLEYLLDVHAVNKDSLKLGSNKVGSIIYLGTAGDMESIMGAKTVFENPKGYDAFPITDYYKNQNRNISFFIPAYMKFREYNDPNGNTKYEYCLKKVLKDRKNNAKEQDSSSYDSDIMFNPIVPDEMLRPNRRSVLPIREAQQRLSDIEAYGTFDYIANVGDLRFNAKEKYGVGFEKDTYDKLRPILKYNVDENKIDKSGAFIIYEQPPEKIPENLYWVLYDPAAKSGDGGSFHSILVYKHFYTGQEKTLEDTIVAEWIGREETLDLNYEKVIRAAKYFNAKIFPEKNIAGFIEWATRMDYFSMLQPDSYNLEKELNPKYKVGYYRVGYQMNERKKTWALQRLHDWLMEIRERDPATNIPTMRTIDYIYSPRILEEIINYREKANFDHISSLLGLMILLGQLDRDNPVKMEEDKSEVDYNLVLSRANKRMRRRSTFENF